MTFQAVGGAARLSSRSCPLHSRSAGEARAVRTLQGGLHNQKTTTGAIKRPVKQNARRQRLANCGIYISCLYMPQWVVPTHTTKTSKQVWALK